MHLRCLKSGEGIISNAAAESLTLVHTPLKIKVSISFYRALRAYLELLAARVKRWAEIGVKLKRKDRILIEINGDVSEDISEDLIAIIQDITKDCEVGVHSKTIRESIALTKILGIIVIAYYESF